MSTAVPWPVCATTSYPSGSLAVLIYSPNPGMLSYLLFNVYLPYHIMYTWQYVTASPTGHRKRSRGVALLCRWAGKSLLLSSQLTESQVSETQSAQPKYMCASCTVCDFYLGYSWVCVVREWSTLSRVGRWKGGGGEGGIWRRAD